MKWFLALAVSVLTGCATSRSLDDGQCLPVAGYSRNEVEALKASAWVVPDDGAREALAQSLLSCLGSTDPRLRDGIAFEALQHWMRERDLSESAMRTLMEDLETQLTAADDDQGFRKPFAALVLAEVARADRVEPFLTAAERSRLASVGADYLAGVRDYRGFDQNQGWRHGVAHGADLAMQLSLNPNVAPGDLLRLRDAISAQVAPDGHFYIYGEYERLARPIVFIARRGGFTEAEWTMFFSQFTTQEDLYATQRGLAWRHNVSGFLRAVWADAKTSPDIADDTMLPGVEAALEAMP